MRDWSKKNSSVDALDKINAILDYDKTSESEKNAFSGMKSTLQSGRFTLSEKQIAWIDSTYKKYELDCADVENLFSNRMVKTGNPITLPYENMFRPLKPPGWKPPNE